MIVHALLQKKIVHAACKQEERTTIKETRKRKRKAKGDRSERALPGRKPGELEANIGGELKQQQRRRRQSVSDAKGYDVALWDNKAARGKRRGTTRSSLAEQTGDLHVLSIIKKRGRVEADNPVNTDQIRVSDQFDYSTTTVHGLFKI
ncbi:hypothetical protein GUJ93_ZPchr0004g39350 [Zizania palustris]|uniref:Uncharacterized protein n=1 Tax=Zizania palustris TaxID=103762 RepID=A0A8J5VMX5_ZIZPA|nr:hypothetical protein GUJ93_ZPchr0004g39350 [Zizania palustris]